MSNDPIPIDMEAGNKPPGQGNVLEQVAKRAQDALMADFLQAKGSLDISQRLRAAEEQKMTLARAEVQRQEFIIGELQQGIEERRHEGKDAGDLGAHLEHAQSRLAEAQDDLKRAEETKTNIGITMESLSQRHQNLVGELSGLGLKPPVVEAGQNTPEQAPSKISVRDALRGIGGKGKAQGQGQGQPGAKMR